MTLDEFMDNGLRRLRDSRAPSRKHVTHPGFLFLYLRLRDGPVLDVANVTVHQDDRGRGLFTKTLRHLKYKYPEVSIRVEGVIQERFQRHLVRLGFEPSTEPCNFFLPAQKDLPTLR
jgi:hypothetical protein